MLLPISLALSRERAHKPEGTTMKTEFSFYFACHSLVCHGTTWFIASLVDVSNKLYNRWGLVGLFGNPTVSIVDSFVGYQRIERDDDNNMSLSLCSSLSTRLRQRTNVFEIHWGGGNFYGMFTVVP